MDETRISRSETAWPVLNVRGPAEPDPLVPPGEYDGYAKHAEIVHLAFGRQPSRRLVIFFELRGGPYDGTRLRFIATLPKDKRLAPSAKLYRAWVVANLGRPPARVDRFDLGLFEHKLFTICVRTVERDRHQRALPECNRYSIVDALVERIA